MLDILNKLHRHTINSIKTHQVETTSENLDLIQAIFAKILQDSRKPSESTLLDKYINIIEDILIVLIENKDFDKVSRIMSSLYKLSTENKFHLYLDNFLYDFLRTIGEIEDITLRKMELDNLFFQIYENAKKQPDDNYDKYISSLYSHFYLSVMSNRNLSLDSKQEVINKFISIVFKYPKNTEDSTTIAQITVYERIVLVLLKNAIDLKDEHSIRNIWQSILKDQSFNQEVYKRIKYIITVYAYYLSYKEGLVNKEEYKKILSEIMRTQTDEIEFEWAYNSDFRDNYSYIKNFLRNWEKMPEEEAKWLMMDNVVTEFYFFFCSAINPEILRMFWETDDLTGLLLNYGDENQILVHKESFENFKDFLGLSSDLELIDSINLLKTLYKEKQTISYNELNEKINDLSDNELCIITDMEEQFVETSLFNNILASKECTERILIEEKKFLVRSVPIEAIVTDRDREGYLNHYKKILLDNLDSFVIQELLDQSHTEKVLIPLMNQNKIIELQHQIDNARQKGINFTRIYTGIKENSHTLYYESLEDRDSYQKCLNDIKVVFNPRKTKEWFLYNPEYIDFNFESIQIFYRDLAEEEIDVILNNNKNKKGNYKLPIVNSISTIFTREEAYRYIKLSRKVVYTVLKFKLEVEKEKSVCFIEFESNREAVE